MRRPRIERLRTAGPDGRLAVMARLAERRERRAAAAGVAVAAAGER